MYINDNINTKICFFVYRIIRLLYELNIVNYQEKNKQNIFKNPLINILNY